MLMHITRETFRVCLTGHWHRIGLQIAAEAVEIESRKRKQHDIGEAHNGHRFEQHMVKEDDRKFSQVTDTLLGESEEFPFLDWKRMNAWMDRQVEKTKARAA